MGYEWKPDKVLSVLNNFSFWVLPLDFLCNAIYQAT